MKTHLLAAALIAATSLTNTAEAAIFGHRSRHTPQPSQPQQPAAKAYKYPTQSRNPWDWHEAHRGYGVKIRGW